MTLKRLAFIILSLFLFEKVEAQTVDTITFRDDFSPSLTQYVNTPLPAKIQRRSSKKGGNIHIDFDANVADSLQLTIGAAADFFASLLPISYEIYTFNNNLLQMNNTPYFVQNGQSADGRIDMGKLKSGLNIVTVTLQNGKKGFVSIMKNQ